VPLIFLLPLLLVIVLVVAAVALRNALGDDAPSWLRGTTIAIGLAFVFFVLSGLGMAALVVGLITASPAVLVAAAVMFVLAFVSPVVVWLAVRPKLQRLRAEERVRAASARAEFEAGAAQRRVEAERLRRERLRGRERHAHARRRRRARVLRDPGPGSSRERRGDRGGLPPGDPRAPPGPRGREPARPAHQRSLRDAARSLAPVALRP
jgi:hypothetical protein